MTARLTVLHTRLAAKMPHMKIWIILLSLLASTATWWWHVYRKPAGYRRGLKQQLKIVSKSFIAGVIVYFVLMSTALFYLMITRT